jgi:3-methyladenine DNA glycosylase/8-oxoguanine DNA glycosylase
MAKAAKKGTATVSLFDGSGEVNFDQEGALSHLGKKDRRLGRLIEQVGPFRLRPETLHSPFASLAEAIIYQQLTGKAAATILGRFKQLFAEEAGGPFPSPAAVLSADDERLRSAGLSRNKAAALRDLAEKTLSGTVPELPAMLAMEEEEIIERLTAVRGVGRWTAEMLLIFRLGRPDVLPVGDYGIRKGFALVFGKKELPTPTEVAARGERWRPYRTVASWYLWRALDAPPKDQ